MLLTALCYCWQLALACWQQSASLPGQAGQRCDAVMFRPYGLQFACSMMQLVGYVKAVVLMFVHKSVFVPVNRPDLWRLHAVVMFMTMAVLNDKHGNCLFGCFNFKT